MASIAQPSTPSLPHPQLVRSLPPSFTGAPTVGRARRAASAVRRRPQPQGVRNGLRKGVSKGEGGAALARAFGLGGNGASGTSTNTTMSSRIYFEVAQHLQRRYLFYVTWGAALGPLLLGIAIVASPRTGNPHTSGRPAHLPAPRLTRPRARQRRASVARDGARSRRQGRRRGRAEIRSQ